MISHETITLLNRLAKFGVDSLRGEFAAQGHSATGHALNNIKSQLNEIPGGIELAFYAPEYATKLNNWQSPSTIHINEWRLRVWMSLPTRGIPQKAYWPMVTTIMGSRIRKDGGQKRIGEGIPTRNSYKYSHNGRRLGWVTVPAEKFIFPAADQLSAQIATSVLNQVADELLSTLTDH